MHYCKISFLGGTGGHMNGIGDMFRRCAEHGLPVVYGAYNDYGSCLEAITVAENHGVPAFVAWKTTRVPGTPNYDLTPEQAAAERWALLESLLPSEWHPDTWLIYGNELRKEIIDEQGVHRANWLGRWAVEMGNRARAAGVRTLAYGWSAGTPDLGWWDNPGPIEYLELCDQYPEWHGVAVHEGAEPFHPNAPNVPLVNNVGYIAGRYRNELRRVCQDRGLRVPDVYVTECAFKNDAFPDVDYAMPEIMRAAEFYADDPEVKAVLLWYLGRGPEYANISQDAQKLIAPVTEYAISDVWRRPPPPPPPPPPPVEVEPGLARVQYPRKVNVIPANASDDDAAEIFMQAWRAGRQTVTGSYDDAGIGALADKTAVLWDIPIADQPVFIAWYADHYPGTWVQFRYSNNGPVLGVSMSHYQDPANCDYAEMAAAGVRFALVKCTEGTRIDAAYQQHIDGWHAVNVATSAWHFLRPDVNPVDQALAYLAATSTAEHPIVPGLDLEAHPNLPGVTMPEGHVRTWLETIEEHTGLRPIIYTNEQALQDLGLLGATWLGQYDYWVADWVNTPPYTGPFWQTHRIHQYEGAGSVPGYYGGNGIMLERYNGTLEQFDAWIAETYEPGPPPPTDTPLIGLHMRADPIYPPHMQVADLNEARTLGSQVIKILSNHPPEMVQLLAAHFPDALFIVRTFVDFRNRTDPVTPRQFFDWTQPDLDRTLAALAGRQVVIEEHNEPNLVAEGWGVSWHDGYQFAVWLGDVRNLRTQHGTVVPWCTPGLSPGGNIAGVRMDAWQFMNGMAEHAILPSYVGVHAYWISDRDVENARQWVTQNAARFAPIIVTEASNPSKTNRPSTAQYAAQLAAFVRGLPAHAVTFYLASGSDWAHESWVDENGNSRGIAAALRQALGN